MDQLILQKRDLTYLSWELGRRSSGTAGSFLKSYSDIGGKKIYYKLSRFDGAKGIVGHECVNELIADRLLSCLGIPHLRYQLLNADILLNGEHHETFLCASENFKERGESKIALDILYEIEREPGESPLEFCIRRGWKDYIDRMLLVDFLILNRDRHGANIEILRNSKKKTIRPAPLFDHGLSLLFDCQNDAQIANRDVMEDKPANNFIGSRSTKENLSLISPDMIRFINPLTLRDRDSILSGLDGVISRPHQDKIWDMIWKRWCFYENFCHSR